MGKKLSVGISDDVHQSFKILSARKEVPMNKMLKKLIIWSLKKNGFDVKDENVSGIQVPSDEAIDLFKSFKSNKIMNKEKRDSLILLECKKGFNLNQVSKNLGIPHMTVRRVYKREMKKTEEYNNLLEG